MKPTLRNILYCIGLIILDLIVYLFIGTLMMNYDDNWNESKGEYGSFSSMQFIDKVAVVAIYLWTLVNVGMLVYVVRSVFRSIKNGRRDKVGIV